MTDHATLESIVANGDYPALVQQIPYATYLGLEIHAMQGDRCYRLPFRDDLIGNSVLQALHGGVVAGLLEMSAVFDVLVSQQQQRIPRSIDFSVDYLRSASARDTWASCTVIRLGRRVAQVRAQAWQEDRGRLIASARAVFLLQNT